MYPRQVWLRWAIDIPVRKDHRRDEHGRGRFHYCTAGVFLLGQVVQRASGQSIEQFVAEHLFEPLAIDSWEFAKSPSGEVMTGGGLRLRSRDLAKIGRLILNHGAWNGDQIVPERFVREMLTVQRQTDNPEQRYGYLIWNRRYQTSCGSVEGWFMAGNGGNAVALFPSHDVVVVVTRTRYNTQGMHQETIRLLEEHILSPVICSRPQA